MIEYDINSSERIHDAKSVIIQGLAEGTKTLISATLSFVVVFSLITFLYLIDIQIPESPLVPVAVLEGLVILTISIFIGFVTISVQLKTEYLQKINSRIWEILYFESIESDFWRQENDKYKKIYEELFLLNFLLLFCIFLIFIGYTVLYLGYPPKLIHIAFILLFIGVLSKGLDAAFLQLGAVSDPVSKRRQEILSKIMSQIEVIFVFMAILVQFISTFKEDISTILSDFIATSIWLTIVLLYVIATVKIRHGFFKD